jgi:hypothetical protein
LFCTFIRDPISNRNESYAGTEMDLLQEAGQQREDLKLKRKIAHAKFEIHRKAEEIDRLKDELETVEV